MHDNLVILVLLFLVKNIEKWWRKALFLFFECTDRKSTIKRMSAKEEYVLPKEIWAKWEIGEYENLRQAVLIFGGNTRNEAVISVFPEVSLYYQDGEASNMIKGNLYLTTKRTVFLPKNLIPHPQLVHLTFDSLRCLAGVRDDLSISISDNAGASSVFKFPTTKALYQCFNLLRRLSDATRLKDNAYKKEIFSIATTEPQETPFASIEFDFSEVRSEEAPQIIQPKNEQKKNEDDGDDPRADSIIEELTPIKEIIEKVNNIHFDIHFKLWSLFVLSLLTFALKFIPFLPLSALICVLIQLYYGWLSIKKDRVDDISVLENPLKKWKGHKIEGYLKTVQFIHDWVMWDNPRKTMSLLQCSIITFVSWIILPAKIYYLALCFGLVVYVCKYATKDIMRHIVTGFWFSS